MGRRHPPLSELSTQLRAVRSRRQAEVLELRQALADAHGENFTLRRVFDQLRPLNASLVTGSAP